MSKRVRREMQSNTPPVSAEVVCTTHGALDIVGMLDDGRDGRYDLLLGKSGPSSEDSIVGSVGLSESWDVGGICPFEERGGKLPWPENSDYMMDVSEVDIAEAFALRQCSKETLPRLVSKPAKEEEHDPLRLKLRDAAHDVGETLADEGIVLKDYDMIKAMLTYMNQAIAVPPPGRTGASVVADYTRVLGELEE